MVSLHVEPDRVGAVLDGFRKLAQLEIVEAPVVVVMAVLRVASDGFRVVRDRLVKLAELVVDGIFLTAKATRSLKA